MKIATDIANFYDRLNLHRLESSLADVGVEPKVVKALNSLLLFWADRNSYGLPVGCDASRLLAECALIPVDKAMYETGVNFIRFVDDYRIFATNFAEAHSHLHFLIEELDRAGLFLNTSKTVFFDISEGDSEESSGERSELGQFENIDEKEKIEAHKSVKVGYVSKIVKHYRFPGVEKVKKLKEVDIEQAAKEAGNAPFEQAEDHIKLFVQAFIYQGGKRDDLLKEIISKYIHSITYIVDALIREADRIEKTEKENIINLFRNYFNENRLSPYYRLMILRLLSSKDYQDISFLRSFLASLNVNESEMLVREFCLRMADVEDRDLLNRVRELYDKSSVVVRRAIFDVYTKSNCILPGEMKAWVKNVNISEADPYIKILAGRIVGGASG